MSQNLNLKGSVRKHHSGFRWVIKANGKELSDGMASSMPLAFAAMNSELSRYNEEVKNFIRRTIRAADEAPRVKLVKK